MEKGRDGRTYLLACHYCNHFYGYVMNARDADVWKNILKRDGLIDMDKVRWQREWQAKSDKTSNRSGSSGTTTKKKARTGRKPKDQYTDSK